MIDERKKIIVEEITYWKEHKLLPEEQCNFLLALYTQGEGEKRFFKPKYERTFMIYLPLLVSLIPLSVVITYLTQFSLTLQISLLIVFLLFSLFSYFLFKRHKFQYTYIALLTTLILILFITVFITNYFSINKFILPLIILLNFIVWYFIGKWEKLKLLQIISVGSFVFTCFYIIFQFT